MLTVNIHDAKTQLSKLVDRAAQREAFTRTLKQALSLVDVQTLDHFIVAGTKTLSFAECGRLL